MLKASNSVKATEAMAEEALKALLSQVPAIKVRKLEREPNHDAGVDIVAHLHVSGHRHALACEVKAIGQPRFVREALFQLRHYVAHSGKDMTPILIAPYLSPEAQSLCRQNDVGFLDFEGNARIVFDGVYIERLVASKPPVERREIKSLFKPKSAQVLSVLLRDPSHAWRVTELAQAAHVSLGHVSNVRSALLAREWGRASEEGLILSQPDELLDSWRDVYRPPAGKRTAFYTTLHGQAFEEGAREVLRIGSDKGQAVFASFSAGHWLAPYGRIATQYFYADESGARRLQTALGLTSPAKGENVVITIPVEDFVFLNALEPAPGAVCTGLSRHTLISP